LGSGAVVVRPPSRLAEGGAQAPERRRLLPHAHDGHEERRALAERSTARHAHEVHAPVQLGHGELDVLVAPGLDGDVFFADFHDPAYVAEAAPEHPDGGADLRAPGRLCELLTVKGRAGGIARIDEAVAVVVATVATDLEAAGVAATITIGVALCEIRDVHAVVARVTHEIAVAVALIGIGDRRAVV